jgi:hypothetical protein
MNKVETNNNNKIRKTSEMKTIKRSESTHDMIRKNSDWYGEKFPKVKIEGSLRLETMLKELGDEYHSNNGWSDYQPSYIVTKDKKNPPSNPRGPVDLEYTLYEVFPIGKDKYKIRDSRPNSPYSDDTSPLFHNSVLNLEQVKEVTENDYGIDVHQWMRGKDIKGGVSGGRTEDGEQVWKYTNTDGEDEIITNDQFMVEL